MNYGQLKVYLREHVNRTDLSDTNFNIWQASANQRLARDTNIVQLDRDVTISNPAGTTVFPIDDDFLFMNSLLSVSIINVNGGPIPLQLVSWEQYVEAKAIGTANNITQPWCYCMGSIGLLVAPGDQSDFEFQIIYRALDRTMSTDTQTNNYLTYAQALYIDAMLIEIYKFLRDTEGEALATQRYDAAAQRHENYYNWQHSGANPGANKGAWSWA